ncbi:DNA topology modulation protein [Pontibacillus sp. HMF3514]|uniref:DNA topology modulation protein n=1 Tax=Pontibacillus sp. HMF3514 TaxID=2692425 RepID=UPI00131F8EAF|nr:DNA topology modulation protein [Pontibacillus sp. HMF3514]QHE52707.1 DNA topology modulation protein [Pontibacillus sp. HMF3514]
MNKIILIGSGGSGKSTLARKMGKKLNTEVHHLDLLFWKSGWVGVPKDEQRRIQTDLVKQEQWIIDGNYGGTIDIRLRAADTIIFLDMPRLLCVYRVFKRRFQYRNQTRPDMRAGTEKVRLEFLKWVWNYPKKKKPQILARLEELSDGKNIIILRSPREARTFLHNID